MRVEPATRPEVARAARPLLIFPCNGNAIEALDCLGATFSLIGFVDDSPGKIGREVHGHSVFSRQAFDDWPDALVLAVPGSPDSFRSRRATIDGLGIAPTRFARVVHPGAHVSPLARLGHNLLVMAGVVITSNASIGDHVCVLPNSVIHHDVTVGDWSLIGANVTIAGHTRVGDNCYIGSGSRLMNGLEIGAGALVGMGSTVIRAVAAGAVVAGSPARPLA